MNNEIKKLKRLLIGYKNSFRKDMINAGIELYVLKEEDIEYMMKEDITDNEANAYYRSKIFS